MHFIYKVIVNLPFFHDDTGVEISTRFPRALDKGDFRITKRTKNPRVQTPKLPNVIGLDMIIYEFVYTVMFIYLSINSILTITLNIIYMNIKESQ